MRKLLYVHVDGRCVPGAVKALPHQCGATQRSYPSVECLGEPGHEGPHWNVSPGCTDTWYDGEIIFGGESDVSTPTTPWPSG